MLAKKYLQKSGVPTLDFVAFTKFTLSIKGQIEKAKLNYPLILKPSSSSRGIGIQYPINDFQELQKAVEVSKDYRNLFVEEYLQGREYTCFVYGNKDEARALEPIHKEGQVIITAYKEVEDKAMIEKIKNVSIKAYIALEGKGYGRVDLKERLATHELFVLEVNCSPNLVSDLISNIAKVNHVELADIFKLIIS